VRYGGQAGSHQPIPQTICLATGTESRKLAIPGEAEFRGRGVSYCAVCDGAFFRDKDIAVIGGGDSAVEEAIFLTKFVKKATLIHRRSEFKATKVIQEKAFANPKIEIQWLQVPVSINGNTLVESITLKHSHTGELTTLPAQGVFIYVGQIPNTMFLRDQVQTDAHGYIITNEKMETSVQGIYAIGDVRKTPLRQIVTAVADGAVAASEIANLL
jgi:thioredoxin reductase (NADPH)